MAKNVSPKPHVVPEPALVPAEYLEPMGDGDWSNLLKPHAAVLCGRGGCITPLEDRDGVLFCVNCGPMPG